MPEKKVHVLNPKTRQTSICGVRRCKNLTEFKCDVTCEKCLKVLSESSIELY